MRLIAKSGRALLAGAAVLALAGPAAIGQGQTGLSFIQPAAAASIRIDFFYDRLSPHGSWIDHRRHGYVFVPAVGPGWRPYTQGHWVYTDDYGWYWVSDEPFAWAVFHYGRWGYDPDFGWYWVPGNVWAPAWVTWRHGGGHVGWAPIGPSGDGYVYGTPDYYEPSVVEAWVFVPERRFIATDIARYVTPVVEINLFLGKASERHHVRYRDGRAYNPFLPRDRVRTIVKQDVTIYNITNVDNPEKAKGPREGAKRTIQTFRAEITKEQPQEKPKEVAGTPDEVKAKPKLKQTAKGDRPKDAPPSAAELKADEKGGKPAGEKAERQSRPGKEEAKTKAGDDARTKGKSEADGKTGPDTGAKTKGQAKSKDQAKPQAEGKADAGSKSKAKTKSRSKPDAEGKAKPDSGKAGAPSEKAKQPKQAAPKDADKPRAKSKPEAPAKPRTNAPEKSKPAASKQKQPKGQGDAPRQSQGGGGGGKLKAAPPQRSAVQPTQKGDRGNGGQRAPEARQKGNGGGSPGGGQAAKGPEASGKGKQD